MTIQISVTVWTVICFLAAMLILDRLLFRPLLSFMDARQEKIDRAAALRADAEAEREKELNDRRIARAEAQQAARMNAAAELEAVRHDTTKAVEQRKAENARWLDAMRSSLDEESAAIRQQLEPLIDEMAVAFANRLLEWQDQEDTGIPLDADSFPVHE